ncbi:MAG: hypothetical protein ABI840_01005 [bacterium]
MRKINRSVFFYLVPIRKKVALNNLSLSFPEKDQQWKKDVIKNSYINLSIDLMEFLYFPKFNKELIKKFVTYQNHKLVQEAKLKNKGIFILSGHFSNWELSAFSYPRIYGEDINVIAKIQASKKLNKRINEYRSLSGNKIIEIGLSLKKIFEKLRKNEIVCFLVDQSANPDYSSYINFFGKSVPAFSGPAKIALRQRPEIILGYGERNKDYSYTFGFEKIEYADLLENTNENIIVLTQRIQFKIEEKIRSNPGQWVWFHKRFKHTRG